MTNLMAYFKNITYEEMMTTEKPINVSVIKPRSSAEENVEPSSVPGPHGWHCVAEGPGENQNEKWFDWSHENNGMRKLNTNLY